MSDGWRDIATAPKDGTEVLAVMGGKCEIVHWHDERYASKPRPYFAPWHPLRGTRWARETQPTHWMPLPPVPVSP